MSSVSLPQASAGAALLGRVILEPLDDASRLEPSPGASRPYVDNATEGNSFRGRRFFSSARSNRPASFRFFRRLTEKPHLVVDARAVHGVQTSPCRTSGWAIQRPRSRQRRHSRQTNHCHHDGYPSLSRPTSLELFSSTRCCRAWRDVDSRWARSHDRRFDSPDQNSHPG
jgi:hypothetical protein